MQKKVVIALLLSSILFLCSCTDLYYRLPVEGNLERLTFFDVLIYAYKTVFGPIRSPDPAIASELVKDFEARPGDTAVSISMIGDIMINRRLLDTAAVLYEHVPKEALDADIRFGNLEFPIHPDEPMRGFPRYNGTVEYFEAVVMPLGINVINIANNHCLDQGLEGLLKTVELLDNRGVEVIGVKRDGIRFITIEVNDLVIAISGYTFSTNGVFVAGDEIVNRAPLNSRDLDSKWLQELIDLVHRMNEDSDIVVLSLHWGFEYEMFPREHQVEIARTLADNGVDLIIGHHPHVLQPIEVYETKEGKLATIVYSLGNWTTDMRHKATRTTSVVKIMLDSTGQITGLEEYPLYLDLNKGQFVPQ